MLDVPHSTEGMAMTSRKLSDAQMDLHAAASRIAGYDDFGDPSYRRALRVLCNAFDSDLELSDAGWRIAYDWIVECLVARLSAQAGRKQHRESSWLAIRRPLVITGLPRTGTSALHRLLSEDQQFQTLECWLANRPMVRPPRNRWPDHPAHRACLDAIEKTYQRAPGLAKIYLDISPEAAQECTAVLQQSFVSRAWADIGLPSYAHWWGTQSADEPYRYYSDFLRLIGAHEPHKRWLLKSPYHLDEIETLLGVFPDACVIHTHRDPLKSIPSYCSLLYTFGRDLGVDARSIGPRQCQAWRDALDRALIAYGKLHLPVYHIDHRYFRIDPLRCVEDLYRHFSLTLQPETRERFRRWIANHSTANSTMHQYDIESWGLSAAQICAAFARYRTQYRFV
jgi:hypothetical protein